MAAFIPDRRDPEGNEIALERVRRDKELEANGGFDGSWVAHPDLVPVCRDAFDAVLDSDPNQIHKRTERLDISAADLLDVRPTPIAVLTPRGCPRVTPNPARTA